MLEEDFSGFGFDTLLFLLNDGVDGELAFARASHFTHIHGGPFRVLVDQAVDYPSALDGVVSDRLARLSERATQ